MATAEPHERGKMYERQHHSAADLEVLDNSRGYRGAAESLQLENTNFASLSFCCASARILRRDLKIQTLSVARYAEVLPRFSKRLEHSNLVERSFC